MGVEIAIITKCKQYLVQASEISHLFLGPYAHHLTRVVLAVAASEPELASHVTITVLEDQNTGFVHLRVEESKSWP